MRKLFLSAVLAVVSLSATGQAHAWGAREQGIVTGIVGTIVAQQLFRPPVVVAPPPVAAVPVPVPVPPPVAYPVAPPMVPYYPGTVYPDYIYRPMFKDVDVWIPECQCYRTMRVQIR
jgi:hypothetical protein